MFIQARSTNVSIAQSSRSQTMLMMAWILDLSADQWRINEFSLRETFDNNPILSVTRRAAHINNKQTCVSISISIQPKLPCRGTKQMKGWSRQMGTIREEQKIKRWSYDAGLALQISCFLVHGRVPQF